MTVWFTSDTHFGHEAIRVLADRPYASLAAMDADLVARWNAVVQPDDTVWHLGDFTHRSVKRAADYRAQLNGTIHLVAGNHDSELIKKHADLFASVQTMAELRFGGRHLVLCHYPLREWDRAWRGSWHLYGHVHGRLDSEPHGFSLDVGVDCHDFAPIDLTRVAALFEHRTSPFKADGTDRAAQSRAQNARRRADATEPTS